MMPTDAALNNRASGNRGRGFTLIELMVALTISTLLLLAISSMYVTQRRVFTTQEVFSSIQDSSRILTRILTHDIRQTGYQDVTSNQASVKDTSIAGTDYAGTGQVGDSITLKFYGSSPPAASATPTYATEATPSIVDCGGNPVPRDAYVTEKFYLKLDTATNSPTLYCDTAMSAGAAAGPGSYPLVEGVEVLQFLYGVDTSAAQDGSAISFQPASANPDMTKVKLVMIGAVLRSNITDQPPGPAIINVFGEAYTNAADLGTAYTPPANDGFLRQQYMFTVAVRNRIIF